MSPAHKPRPAIDTPYLTAEEAAVYLKFASTRALYKAIPQSHIPVCRRGNKTMLFDRRELDAWLHGDRSKPRRARRSSRPLALVTTSPQQSPEPSPDGASESSRESGEFAVRGGR